LKNNLLPLSIFIICKNEAHIIEDTLRQAAKLADEIILVDSGSIDATIDIAKQYATKIYTQEWLGYAKQKNYALSLCKHKWVLSLDADEVLTDRLIEEIKNLFESGQHKKSLGFKIPRRLFIGKQLVKYGGFYPDYQLRLFEKGFGRFQDLPVHESVELWDETRQDYVTKNSFTDIVSKFFNPKLKRKIIRSLNYPLDHYSYNSIEELEAAFMNYARLSNKKASSIFASLKAVYAFFYKYFIRAGILDGNLGLQLAFINAKYTYSKYKRSD
jgi:glycosyltransferase involved in cell wall biosynthesis